MAGIITGESVRVDRYPYGNNPKALPVDSSLLRLHLQVPQGDDELLFGPGGKLATAVSEVEQTGNVSLIRQKRKHFIGDNLAVPPIGVSVVLGCGPILTVTAVKYLDTSDAEQTLSTALWSFRKGEIYFKNGSYPEFAEGPNVLWIEYEAGYGDSFLVVPADWQSIVMQYAMRRYEVREGADRTTDKTWQRMMDIQIARAGSGDRY